MDEHPAPYVHNPLGNHRHTIVLLHGTSQTGPEFAAALLNYKFPYVPQSLSGSPFPSNLNLSQNSNSSSDSRLTPLDNSLLPPNLDLPQLAPQHVNPTVNMKYTLPQLLPDTKFVFPTGSRKPTTVFNGKITHAWFDIYDFGDRTKGEEDQIVGMRESARYLAGVIERENLLLKEADKTHGHEKTGLKDVEEKVVLLGFSQGCAMGVLMVLSEMLGPHSNLDLVPRELGPGAFVDGPVREAGIDAFIGLSGWLPFRSQISSILSENPNNTSKIINYVRSLLQLQPLPSPREPLLVPLLNLRNKLRVWLGHGGLDTKVKLEWALQMVEVLEKSRGIELESNVFAELGHWFDEIEMGGLVQFLRTIWGLNLNMGDGEVEES
jgi:predicted esterase